MGSDGSGSENVADAFFLPHSPDTAQIRRTRTSPGTIHEPPVIAFFLFWALGAALLISCTALVWSERISVLRTVPTCTACGYDLTGLDLVAQCPECAGMGRMFRSDVHRTGAAGRVTMLWMSPVIAGLFVAGITSVAAHIPSPDNVVGLMANTLPFMGTGALLRLMRRWITPRAATTMILCSVGTRSIALAGIMLDAWWMHDLATTPGETYRILPLMTLPFAGYGLAGGILLLSLARARSAR
jgi:hypothetical protein